MLGSEPKPLRIQGVNAQTAFNEVDIAVSNGMSVHLSLSRDQKSGRARLFIGFQNNGLWNVEVVDLAANGLAVLFGRSEGP